MGLASSPSSRSVVELSLSPCYHYQYSSISKTIAGVDKKVGIERKRDEEAGLDKQQERLSRLAVEKNLSLKADYIPEPSDDFYLLNTDISSLYCPHSECLAERRHVYKSNNKMKGNRPVEIDYELSM